MTNSSPHATPASQAGNFHAEGRTVDAGRGWDWIVEGFALFRRQPGMWILIALLTGIVFIAISTIPILFMGANINLVASMRPVTGALSIALFPIVGGLMLGCRALDQGGALELAHLFAGYKHKTVDLIVVGAVNVLGWAVIDFAVDSALGGDASMGLMRGGIEGAGMPMASSLIALLLVAGLSVPLAMATWFAPALIVLHDMAPAASLKASFFACLGNWIPFLVYGVVLLVLCVVAAIPAGLGFLVLVPVMVTSVYTAYGDIFCTG